jgi:pyruvate kinase
MDLWRARYAETPLVKTKIVATIGPACESPETLEQLVQAGADLFRLNFAHGNYEWFTRIIGHIRQLSAKIGRPIGLLGDLSGPKIRLGEIPEGSVRCRQGAKFQFVRTADLQDPSKFTCTYEQLIDDLRVGDRVLLADGTVSLRVVDCPKDKQSVICEVVQPGVVRSRQGVNLPGVALSTPALTEKDRHDLKFALEQQLDYVSLSFVRSADDIRLLRKAILEFKPALTPWIVAKIEKTEALADLERIIAETDAVMVARGDLGVEADIARVPTLQKQIIRLCNQHRIPVITATQMLDSMQKSELPTRAEVSDVANAVLDGTDAVMLSGETAAGDYPVQAVSMMSRVCQEAERLLEPRPSSDTLSSSRTRATVITEAVTHGAGAAAERLGADFIVVATRGGKTAMALSKQRRPMPIIALTDHPEVARRMCLFWGVTPVETNAVALPPQELLAYIESFGREQHILLPGNKLVLVGSSNWSKDYHDMMLVHVVS